MAASTEASQRCAAARGGRVGVLLSCPVVASDGGVQSLEEGSSPKKEGAGQLAAMSGLAGLAAAGLGGAAIAGGLAVDVTAMADIAMLAGVYGMANAVGGAQTSDLKAKGAAGPLFSALISAGDLAQKVKGIRGGGERRRKAAADPAERAGVYAKSTMANQSKASSGRAEAAAAVESKVSETVQRRRARMQRELGPAGMQALEDGVAQVMSEDVGRILQVRPRDALLTKCRSLSCCARQDVLAPVCAGVRCPRTWRLPCSQSRARSPSRCI